MDIDLNGIYKESWVLLGVIGGVGALIYLLRYLFSQFRELLDKQLVREETSSQQLIKIIEESNVSRTDQSIATHRLADVLERSESKISTLPTKEDVKGIEDRMTIYHKDTHSKLDKIIDKRGK